MDLASLYDGDDMESSRPLDKLLKRQPCALAQLYDIARCEYWQRVWIVQELMLAKDVSFLHGGCSTDWSFWYAFCFSGLHTKQEVAKFLALQAVQIFYNERNDPDLSG